MQRLTSPEGITVSYDRCDSEPPLVPEHVMKLVRYEAAGPDLLGAAAMAPLEALAAALPHARVEELPGQAHEGMTAAPEQDAASVVNFLLG